MSRKLNNQEFVKVFNSYIIEGKFNEKSNYYSVYKFRYKTLIKYFCDLVEDCKKVTILDVGGGQYAMICKKMWDDLVYVADIDNRNFEFLNVNQIETINCDLTKNPISIDKKFDVIFLSEVIGHIPIPPHIILSNLKSMLKKGGFLIMSTPNLYRIRNVLYMALGKRIFDNFTYADKAIGRFCEYSKNQVEWQLKTAGFEKFKILLKHLTYKRSSLLFNIISFLGMPFFIIPRFRDNLVVIAQN